MSTRSSCVLLLAIAACGGNSTPSSTVDYLGTIEGTGGVTGKLTVSVSAGNAGASAATGQIVSGGTTTDLTGTFDGATLALSGAGFMLTGMLLNGVLSGTFTSAAGGGNFSGQASSATAAAIPYCGTFLCNAGCSGGVWNLTQGVSGTVSGGFFSNDGKLGDWLIGTASGTSLSFTGTKSETGSATVSGSTVSGTWTCPDGAACAGGAGKTGAAGTFTGSTAGCH